jgi:DNA modification methylase
VTDDLTLPEFLAKYSRLYDPEGDTFDRPPFASDIKEGKNDPIYNAHSYHTKVPPRGIVPYILHYTEPGDLILDPFCGTGMTGVASELCANPPKALMEVFPELNNRVGLRPAILGDISPSACHIAYNYTTPADVHVLKDECDRIKVSIREEFDWLYGTEHYEPALGQYDPSHPEVGAKLKNAPSHMSTEMFRDDDQRTWELVNMEEVESRLGYAVTELPREAEWEGLDVSRVKDWVCIPATIQYVIWSDVLRCEGFVTIEQASGRISLRGKNAGKPSVRRIRAARGCGSDIVLWDVAVDHAIGEVLPTFRCPNCDQEWFKRQLSLSTRKAVIACYEFEAPNGQVRVERRVSRVEYERIAEIESRSIPYWYPSQEVDLGREMMRHGLLKRGVKNITDFYTKRNLWALGRLWDEVNHCPDQRTRRLLRFVFTSLILSASALNRHNFGAQPTKLSGTLYIPAFREEANVCRLLDGKVKSITEALQEIGGSCQSGASERPVLTYCGSATKLELPDSSIDYIFTDPPFGSNIFYSDCSLLLEAWLDTFTDETQEIVINERRKGGPFKTLDQYASLMRMAFLEMFRVLKPGRWATVEFNSSDGQVFEAIKGAALDAGFEIVNMLLMDKKQKTFKQIQGAKGVAEVVDKDVLFNLNKPRATNGELRMVVSDLEQQIAQVVHQHLQTLPSRIITEPTKYNADHRTTATINSVVMNALIPKGVNVDQLSLSFIDRVCSRYFRRVGQRWYLRGEPVGSNLDDARLIEEEVTIDGEISAIEWIRQRLKAGPIQLGELKPLWMRATGLLPVEVSQQLDLEELLEVNFWKDHDSNKWREPTEEERERMNDDRSLRVLHDAERFAAGSLRRSTTDSERCEWVDVLFKACKAVEENDLGAMPVLRGFDEHIGYILISRLFQSILNDSVELEVYRRVEKQARVASQRLNNTLENEKKKVKATQRKERGPTLFEGIDDE